MRRGGGYQSGGGILHPHHQHGPHQSQRLPNRIQFQHQQHILQNLHPQLVPYVGHHVNSPRPVVPSFPPTNSGHHYAAGVGGIGGGSGGGGHQNTISSCGNYSSSVSGPTVPTVPVGGDMPPVETVVARLETACRLLHGIGGNNTRVNEIGVEIQILSEDLRRVGPLLETAYPDVLDRVMSSMRDASAQPSLPPSLRLAIFELVELRASKWLLPSDSSNYYRQRRNINDSSDSTPDTPTGHHSRTKADFQERSPPMGTSPIPCTSNSTTSEGSSSGGGANKTYREEVVIKNSDSGKVASTSKERVLSINGYSQQSISMAKQLIQETIQRNSSPVFDGLVPSSSGTQIDSEEDLLGESVKKMNTSSNKLEDARFCYSVTLGEDVIRVTGSNLQFVQEAKFALDDHFSQKYPELFYASNDVEDEEEGGREEAVLYPKYDRTTLLSLSLVSTKRPDFLHLEPEIRSSIVLDKPRHFDPERFCREKIMQVGIIQKD